MVLWRRGGGSPDEARLEHPHTHYNPTNLALFRHTRSSADADNRLDAFSGQSRSTNMVPFHMLHIVSYCAVVTLCLSRAVFTIFVFQKFHDLEMGVKGHSRSLRVISFDRKTYIVFFSNFVPKMHRFWDIRLQKCRELEKRVRGASRSLEMSPCDRKFMTSYWRSIVTMALSRVVSEIFNVEKYCDLEMGVRGHSRSLKVVPFGRSCMVSY